MTGSIPGAGEGIAPDVSKVAGTEQKPVSLVAEALMGLKGVESLFSPERVQRAKERNAQRAWDSLLAEEPQQKFYGFDIPQPQPEPSFASKIANPEEIAAAKERVAQRARDHMIVESLNPAPKFVGFDVPHPKSEEPSFASKIANPEEIAAAQARVSEEWLDNLLTTEPMEKVKMPDY